MNNPYQSPNHATSNHPGGSMVHCRACHKELHSTASICPNCGCSQRFRPYKSKTGTALLALFLGSFGAHRFYLGQWWGIFYLLLFWTFVPAVFGLVEFFVFLLSDQQKWDAKYNDSKPQGPGEGVGAGVIVALVVGVFVFTALIGILAAIAIPSYQDYTYRSQVTMALSDVQPIKRRYSEYLVNNQSAPLSNQQLDMSDPFVLDKGHQVTISPSGITITFKESVRKRSLLHNQTLILTPAINGENIHWLCTEGSLENKFRPTVCR